MRCLQSEGDVLKRLRPIIAEFFDVNESTVSPLIEVVYIHKETVNKNL